MARVGKSNGWCLVYVIVGAVIGGLLGDILAGVDALKSAVPYLVQSYPVLVIEPSVLDLYVVKLTAGISFSPNFLSVLGIIIAIYIFRKY